MHLLAGIVAIPMHHRIHHAFPNCHSDLVQLLLLEPDVDGILQNRRFRDLHAVQIGIKQHLSFCHSFASGPAAMPSRMFTVEYSGRESQDAPTCAEPLISGERHSSTTESRARSATAIAQPAARAAEQWPRDMYRRMPRLRRR